MVPRGASQDDRYYYCASVLWSTTCLASLSSGISQVKMCLSVMVMYDCVLLKWGCAHLFGVARNLRCHVECTSFRAFNSLLKSEVSRLVNCVRR